MSADKELAYAIIEYLQSKNDVNPSKIGEAIGAISSAFGVDATSTSDYEELGMFPFGTKFEDVVAAGKDKLGMMINLKTALADAQSEESYTSFVENVSKRGYFEGTIEGTIEHMQRQSKLVKKFQEKAQSGGAAAKAKKAKDEAAAEELKATGNSLMSGKDYEGAIKSYTDALALSSDGPNSHVYYSNRAAANCSLKQYQEAADDCEAAVALQPTYAKAVARLGLAYYFLGNYEKAVDSYEMAVTLEPENKSSSDALQKAKNKLNKQNGVAPSSSAGPGGMGGGGMDLASMMAGMGGGGGGGGGMPDGLAGMMNNPGFMAQAQEMMKNPAMMAQAQKMMQDPDAMQKAMSMMGKM
jgi:small glutamine-rich tetratricopeptide repeat-containing protein alpha